ncbi:tRNA (adenosine(37)-N6)-threonylcarbamoyltransferase complex transferase subunit TsaD [Patescibacteria group bacterium]|nr:tRNA (adenosine(37)-N6)-threonylcarbamoyltransferase complex transferase subunit TsaD [Patescibacteria group bacterium]
MIILSIETTCDDTAIAIVKYSNNNFKILSNVLSSQIKEHNAFGGVVPELASRCHIQNSIPVLDKALKNSKISQKNIDYIAITNKGGGLIGSQIVGVEMAKTISFILNKNIVQVNHIRAHSLAVFMDTENNRIRDIKFPIISLTASGGHTFIVLIKDFDNFKVIGRTIDDASGEAFDKVAKMLNLGYPGGPIISKYAKKGKNIIDFPRPMINSSNFDFSFSGLKTSVLYYLRDNKNYNIENVCCSFQEAVCDILTYKTIKAVKKYKPKSLIIAGGVSANIRLKELMKERLNNIEQKICFYHPDKLLTTDNALMVNINAYFLIQNKKIDNWKNIKSNSLRSI